jgi:hypothetical protein
MSKSEKGRRAGSAGGELIFALEKLAMVSKHMSLQFLELEVRFDPRVRRNLKNI